MATDTAIPLSVPQQMHDRYLSNLERTTHGSGRLFHFAADQKIEHLNQDFVTPNIAPECADPQHLFKIASSARIGAFATHFGLVARYGQQYRSIPYIIKLNGKTNLIPTSQHDPVSTMLQTVDQIITLGVQSGLTITGVGYTIYLGSQYEHLMLAQAAQMVLQAHAHGLLAILWIYPRGKAVPHEKTAEIIAGAAGVGLALGTDFVKVNVPDLPTPEARAQALLHASTAAGSTGLICAGGPSTSAIALCQEVALQLNVGNARGAAIGRNIFQRPLPEAITLCNALATLIIDKSPISKACSILEQS